jgi:hypothetical protein
VELEEQDNELMQEVFKNMDNIIKKDKPTGGYKQSLL